MGIDEIKRWQWILIGILAGLGMAYVWTGVEVRADRDMSCVEFERDLMRKDPKSGKPIIRDIVIRPAVADYQGKLVQPVTFKQLRMTAKTGQHITHTGAIIAPMPYRPTLNPPSPVNANLTIADYLASVQKKYPHVGYRRGWESERPVALSIGALFGALVIGGAWPTLLNLLVGAGMGPKHRERKKPEYDLSRFGKSKPEPQKPKPGRVVTEADRAQLEKVTRAYESELAGAGLSHSATPQGGASQAPVRKLEAGPLEIAPTMKNPDDDDEIEVKGEYYPVLIHHHKKHDEAAPPEQHKKP
ncbi:MAG: hypothetical protein ACREJC_13705 [Tepidisphaeraceae bacterium]